MLRGLYTAAAGMLTQQRRHDTITNNIANMNTPGFKQATTVQRSFPEMMIAAMGTDQQGPSPFIGNMYNGVFGEESVSLHVQGDLQETYNPYDFALVSNLGVNDAAGNPMIFDATGQNIDANGTRTFQPQPFFAVLNGQGEQRYTLNGKFTANENRELVTLDGNRVLGNDGQPIVLTDANGEAISDFRVTASGAFVDHEGNPIVNANGDPLSLLIMKAQDPNRMLLEGNGLYTINPEDQATLVAIDPNNPLDNVEVRQGFIERSNVDSTQSMIDLMSAMRNYEANQKMIQYYDKSLEKAVNEVGRV
ncbi:flagellar hook-basal body protein [Paenibacillus albiflavus]|uniref:Flagellar hook-basal body protein n=1 Tax=Paenibacillus albiflavus TaxID=2545760 RepID=A0A4R4ECD4_9BACL|nr:flagellar hook-basal body protein [Paenibacillus albiflavus]TCZ76813.1 flagellar hook-basal body protein [Paenibacillus albiflavus]